MRISRAEMIVFSINYSGKIGRMKIYAYLSPLRKIAENGLKT
jgi:hypothetical protein